MGVPSVFAWLINSNVFYLSNWSSAKNQHCVCQNGAQDLGPRTCLCAPKRSLWAPDSVHHFCRPCAGDAIISLYVCIVFSPFPALFHEPCFFHFLLSAIHRLLGEAHKDIMVLVLKA